MTNPTVQDVLDLYKPPFRWYPYSYILDANNERVADFPFAEVRCFRVRGWDSISCLPNADALHNACTRVLGTIVLGHEDNPEKCVQLLNEYWEKHTQ